MISFKIVVMMTLLLNACGEKPSSGPTAEKVVNFIEKSADTIHHEEFTLEYLMGKFDPKTHPDFKEIPIKYADQQGRMMRKDALDSFISMAEKASQSGITLIIKSSTRNFEYQKGIWEKKWSGETILDDGTKASDIKSIKQRALKILEYSSMPGTSRHHWGTDIDINDFENAYFTKGEGKKVYEWMKENAAKYGFCQVYSNKEKTGRTGYNEERWHWSFMPVSGKLTKLASDHLTNEMITGFLGSEAAVAIDVKKNYILGLNADCK